MKCRKSIDLSLAKFLRQPGSANQMLDHWWREFRDEVQALLSDYTSDETDEMEIEIVLRRREDV